jgi:hypothetical protein
MTQTALYRHYDAEGRLLYVGISLSAVQRLAQHADKDWSADIRRVEIEMHPDRGTAEAAEKAAIKAENPVHNKLRPAAALKVRCQSGPSDEGREAVRWAVAKIGQEKIVAALGRTPGVIRNAVIAGHFPAPWYAVIRDLCIEQGIECPIDAFKWSHGNALGKRVAA